MLGIGRRPVPLFTQPDCALLRVVQIIYLGRLDLIESAGLFRKRKDILDREIPLHGR